MGRSSLNEPPGPVEAREYLASQPPELRVPNALERIRRKIGESGRRLALLDDDPTGTQTVHGVPVLTTWSVEDLRWALEQPSSTFYILTNSRSFPEEEAARMNCEISVNLACSHEHDRTRGGSRDRRAIGRARGKVARRARQRRGGAGRARRFAHHGGRSC
ncbi:MAG TPA: four-carbon acid sugar kinase family protein [Rubrobacter sp.]|nr:four-carbon acid sugar kinase family protein [Rubrobacter sp.]